MKMWFPLLSDIMEKFPGACGAFRGQILSALVNLIGTGCIRRTDLGRLVCLYAQVGGGGKEGVEHTKSFSTTWKLVFNTTTNLLNEMFKFVQEAEKPVVTGDRMSLPVVSGSMAGQLLALSQFADLIEILCSLLTYSFPQGREIRCEEILNLIMRVLSVNSQNLKADIPELDVLRLLLPTFHLHTFNLLKGLIVCVEDDILPEIATINNIIIKSFDTNKSNKVREALYSVLSTYIEILGPATGLEYCLNRILPHIAQDTTPYQEKILLGSNQHKGKRSKKKHTGGAGVVPPVSRVHLNLSLCSAALHFIGVCLDQIGALLSAESYRDISCLLINLGQSGHITDLSAITSLLRNLGSLCRSWNPLFRSPLRLCIHILQRAALHSNPGIVCAARRELGLLNTLIHPQCPSLSIPLLEEKEMRRVVLKLLEDQAEDDERDEENLENKNELESSCNPQSEAVEELLPVKTLAAPPSPVRTAPIDPPASRKSTLTSTKPGKRHFENAADGKVENLGSEKKKAREEQGDDDILNDVEQLENNVKEIKRMEESKRKDILTKVEDETESLDVSTMLKDFSDKLNQNLVPDPWEEDSE
ncbi:uncharacterized protein LOC111714999 isoform X3 [Eurytemora carolleeae]|nr:uncharacterized protein LOC111714999 isoform X3 [Eurytemora carolleeae]|eukprot:XP_023346000.1 uncharacterized protein LOC111714999 isoform X3 [Eurytemora affinis]